MKELSATPLVLRMRIDRTGVHVFTFVALPLAPAVSHAARAIVIHAPSGYDVCIADARQGMACH